MTAPPPTATVRIRARFAETDAMGVVHHTSYLVWFEVARTELLRSLGLPYADLLRRGFHLPLVEAHASYLAPSRYDDEVQVKISQGKLGRSSVRLDYEVGRVPGGELVCRGYTIHVLVGADGRPQRLPGDLRAALSP